jgi:DNA-binding NarL/FixJ family response regulator
VHTVRVVIADDQELVRSGFAMILEAQTDISVVAEAGIVCADTATRVVMLTTFDQDDYVYNALLAGASGFLLKDVRRDDLVQAVRVVAAGEALLSPAVTRRLIDDMVRRRPRPAPASPDLDVLTARELEALVLLGRGLSNAEIAAELVVSEHTVKTHVSNVLSKLHLRDRVQAAITAYERGLIVPGSSPDDSP